MALKPGSNQMVRLPTHPFFYTVDQIALLMGWSVEKTKVRIFFVGRSRGERAKTLIEAYNMAEPNKPADWRIAEREFVRWLRVMGYQIDKERY